MGVSSAQGRRGRGGSVGGSGDDLAEGRSTVPLCEPPWQSCYPGAPPKGGNKEERGEEVARREIGRS